MADRVAIAAKGLSKTFAVYRTPRDLLVELLTGRSRHSPFDALRDASFDVLRGEVVGVMGRNGAGKSTLLKLIAGTLEPTRGSVRVDGRVAAILELGTGFHPQYTGRENVILGGMCLGMTEREARGKLEQIVDFAELREFIDQPLRTYSTGMHTRLAFATAVAVDPQVLIIDEALSVGDAKFQLKCYDKFRAFRREGRTILLVSHSSEQITLICDRALLLERGALLEDGPANEVTRKYHRLLFGGGELALAAPAAPAVGAAPGAGASPTDRASAGAGAPPVAADDSTVTQAAFPAPGEDAASRPAAPEAIGDPLDETTVTSARAPMEGAAAPEPSREAPQGPGVEGDVGTEAELHSGTRMGTREAQIERIAIIDEDGRDVRRLEPGAAYRLRFEAVARSDQSTLSAGFLVRDRSGQTIFGLDTRLDRELGFAVRAGERFAVSMRILNHLGPGEYFLSFGIARLDGTKLDYCYDAVQFVVGRRQGVYHASRADLDGALAIERLGGDRGPSESRPVERAAPRVDDP